MSSVCIHAELLILKMNILFMECKSEFALSFFRSKNRTRKFVLPSKLNIYLIILMVICWEFCLFCTMSGRWDRSGKQNRLSQSGFVCLWEILVSTYLLSDLSCWMSYLQIQRELCLSWYKHNKSEVFFRDIQDKCLCFQKWIFKKFSAAYDLILHFKY